MNQETKLKSPQLEVGDYFDMGWKIFKDNFSSFLTLALVIDLPLAIIQIFVPVSDNPEEMANPSNSLALGFAVLLIVLSIVSILSALIMTESSVLNRPIEVASAIQQGFSRLIPSLLVVIVSTILVAVGFILLIVPGIYIANLLYFVLYAVALRGQGLDALSYSRDLVKGQWWKIFGRSVLISFGFGVVTFVVMAVFGFAGLVVSQIPFAAELVSVVGSVISGLLAYLFVAITTIFFLNVDYVRHQN
ncbi:MAG: hypothetical protein R6U67_12190 [Sodalinema sp.]|uniref:hypothetical protein n=1 Tax=Sodalinema sp. TaxID=3080550 RepID=UPI00396F45FB